MGSGRAEIQTAAEFVRARLEEKPVLGAVLGSGLGAFADGLEGAQAQAYGQIPHLPRVSVPGHAGRLVVGGRPGRHIACLQGRVHLYEGYAAGEVVFGVRLLAEIGCRAVLLTNAAGGIRRDLGPGSLMLVRDHLNLTGQNPLVGSPPATRFTDLSRAYDTGFLELGRRAATLAGVDVSEGVYAGLLGPSYETPAEVRMLAGLGADAVGMSTVLEVIALRELGVRVGAVSSITNHAAGHSPHTLDHAEVERVARANQDSFTGFLRRWSELVAEEVA